MAESATDLFKYSTGKQGLKDRGYPAPFIDSLTDHEAQSYCGVGNPLAIDPAQEAERIVDIGCGVGIDMLYAKHCLGSTQSIHGTELSQEMAAKARVHCIARGLPKNCITVVEGDQLPFADGYFDRVISNGVLNLSPQKEIIFSEIYRVLQKGGKLCVADIFLEDHAPQTSTPDPKSWAQ